MGSGKLRQYAEIDHEFDDRDQELSCLVETHLRMSQLRLALKARRMPAFLRKREVFLLDCWALCRESWWRCPRPIADPQTIAAPSSPGRTGNCSRRALVQIIDG